MKSFLILIVGLVSLGVFLYNGSVDWQAGIILSVGSIIGAYIGSNFAMQESSRLWVFRIIKVILAFELLSLITRWVLANSHVL